MLAAAPRRFNARMCGVSKKRVLLAALIGFCDVVALHDARAEPPQDKAAGALLDLRPPAAEQSAPLRSPLQEIAHNFRREGLPVAKLFQDRTSLLHLGLNPRGTPGLWFVHQVR